MPTEIGLLDASSAKRIAACSVGPGSDLSKILQVCSSAALVVIPSTAIPEFDLS